MPTSTNVTNLKINELTEAQYDTAVQGGVIGVNELSIITDLDDAIQVDTIPTAGASELGKVYQFVGTTNANYTHGYFYECVSDGQNPATYSWSQLNVQPTPTAPVTSVNTKTGVVVLDANDVGAIPQLSTLPTAALAILGMVVQYIGADDAVAGLTHGYIYECTTDGSTYSWTQTNVQPAGGSSLPSQTGNSGKFLTTDGTDASWATINALQNTSTGTDSLTINGTASTVSEAINIGKSSYATKWRSLAVGVGARGSASKGCAIGPYAEVSGNFEGGTAIGHGAIVTAVGAIQIGSGQSFTNSTANTLKVSNSNSNYEMMSADGTIPTDRFTTTPVADGTYVPTLTISSGTATRSWSTPSGGGSTSTTGTLVSTNWSSNSQTINVTGVTANNNVIVAPAPASTTDYTAAGITCTAQGAGTLTFSCQTVPTNAITVNVVILN